MLATLTLCAPAARAFVLEPDPEPTLAQAPQADAEAAYQRALDRSQVELGEGRARLKGRALFSAVLGTEAYLHAEAGPFDVYVYLAGDLEPAPIEDTDSSGSPPTAKAKTKTKTKAKTKSSKSKPKASEEAEPLTGQALAEQLLDDAVSGLSGLVGVMEQSFPARGEEPRLVAGRRFPIVLCSDDGTDTFAELVALLDHSEPAYTGFTSVNGSLWTEANLAAPVVRNWEAQLVNLSHPTLVEIRGEFLEHGLGYFTIAHLVRRLVVFGSYGNPPPWLADGLVDELDIQAHGEAWVGGDWFEEQTPGWYRPGWEGFVPEGQRPPPPIRGPPEDLAVTIVKTGDMWAHRTNSPMRHWNELVEDRSSEAPASFAFMAQNESFLPRDRALARCTLHLMLEVAPPEQEQPGLLTLLDRPRRVPANGMPDSEPLPEVFAQALGGVDGVDNYAEMTGAQLLESLGHPEIADHMAQLGAAEALQLADHRDMAAWLYQQYDFGAQQRQEIWNGILAIEYHRQLAEWERIGEVLDQSVAAALEASKSYPESSSARRKVAEAFRSRGAG